MKIKEIEERIKNNYSKKELDNFSSFVVAECINNNEITEVIPITNKTNDLEISGKDIIITDKDGNLLINKASSVFENRNIVYANLDKLVLETSRERWLTFDTRKDIIGIELYEYKDGKVTKVDTLFNEDKDKNIDIEIGNIDRGVLIIRKTDKNDITRAYLYSVPKKKIISPYFATLEKVTDTDKDIYKFTDIIVSNKTLDDEHLKSEIVGFIDGEGRMLNEIYDENKNSIRDAALHEGNEFHDYECLKNDLKYELDVEIEHERVKKNIRNNSIKILELTAKISS